VIDQQGAVAPIKVPYFRAALTETEVNEVVACLRSGWLTTGPRVQEFERRFAQAVGAEHAIAVNSCTAALHLALEAVGLKPGQAVLVPTLTFAATAEVVRYQGAVPVLVDCDPLTGNIDLSDAADKLRRIRAGRPVAQVPAGLTVVGILPVHLGGNMLDMSKVAAFAEGNDLWVIEDAAHAFPAAWRPTASSPWQHCGASTALITCFSFYANKTLTTGEGGMAVTGDAALAERMRLMSLHGLSRRQLGRPHRCARL
jgi:dTDP-4-amino-4,6-dideoxygalactose transaminase